MPSHPERVRRNQPEVNEPEAASLDAFVQSLDRSVADVLYQRFYGCPCCHGPSTRGGICLNCLRTPDEPTAETPWGV